MKILILSSVEDPHAQAVSAHLQRMGAIVDYLRFEEFVEQCASSYRVGSTNGYCLLERGRGDLDLYSYCSVWHRRPGILRIDKQYAEPWIRQMVQQESRAALDGMLLSMNCLWMNFPINDKQCGHKLWQLQLAKEVGLSIPETLLTNKPDLVKAFFEECEGEVVYKLLGETTNQLFPATERPSGMPTLRLRYEDLPFIDQVAHVPHLFQKCIRRGFDLRAAIVGKDIFCIRIDSQSGNSKTDWRADYSVAMEPYRLPEDVSHKCLRLMQRLGLNYGAVDLILTDEGDIVFIEINSAGQYLFMETRANLPISLAIAKLLGGESEPLVKAGVPENPNFCT